MKIDIDKEKLLSISILVIIAALFYNLFILPQRRQLKGIRHQYISGIQLLEARETKEEEFENLKAGNREWKKKLEAIENRFLHKDEVNPFLKSLTRLAEQTQVKLETVDPLEKKPPSELGIEKMLVKITVAGRCTSIIHFMNLTKARKNSLGISNVKIESKKGTDQDLKATFVLTLFIIEDENQQHPPVPDRPAADRQSPSRINSSQVQREK